MKLSNLTILITGGGSDIGLELARQVSSLGNTVFICGRNAEKLRIAARRHGLRSVHGDVTRANDQETILKTIAAEHGRLDLIVNNPGVFGAYNFAEDPDTVGRIQEEVKINAIVPLTVTKHAGSQLLQSEEPTNLFVGLASPLSRSLERRFTLAPNRSCTRPQRRCAIS